MGRGATWLPNSAPLEDIRYYNKLLMLQGCSTVYTRQPRWFPLFPLTLPVSLTKFQLSRLSLISIDSFERDISTTRNNGAS